MIFFGFTFTIVSSSFWSQPVRGGSTIITSGRQPSFTHLNKRHSDHPKNLVSQFVSRLQPNSELNWALVLVAMLM